MLKPILNIEVKARHLPEWISSIKLLINDLRIGLKIIEGCSREKLMLPYMVYIDPKAARQSFEITKK
ncbi:MAG: hypothetical protein LCH54_12330 [Bacteroidetes bacterium]|nr:hypothetical protein [Bacteroidota bacterium]